MIITASKTSQLNFPGIGKIVSQVIYPYPNDLLIDQQSN